MKPTPCEDAEARITRAETRSIALEAFSTVDEHVNFSLEHKCKIIMDQLSREAAFLGSAGASGRR